MSEIRSYTLREHFRKQKPNLNHIEYLDKIFADIDPRYRDKFLEIRRNIELTLLKNPDSENKVVSYLSGVSEKLTLISRKRGRLVREETNAICA